MIILFILQTTILKTIFFPFHLTEILLKIFFHFQSDSRFRLKTTVLDLQKSYDPAYIFMNEFSCFNPIIFDSEQNYRTVSLCCGDNNGEEDLIYALFLSNKIFPFQSYDLPHNQKAFAAFKKHENPHFHDHFLVAAQTSDGELRAIAYGTYVNSRVEFHDYLDCISKAHNLNCFKKFHLKVFDLYDKYQSYLSKTRWLVFSGNYFNRSSSRTSVPVKILELMSRLILLYIGCIPIYHARMLPFYINYCHFFLNFFYFNIILL